MKTLFCLHRYKFPSHRFILIVKSFDFAVSDSPVVDTSVLTHPSLPMSTPGTPDLLVNTLELKRTLRKWSHDKEKVTVMSATDEKVKEMKY